MGRRYENVGQNKFPSRFCKWRDLYGVFCELLLEKMLKIVYFRGRNRRQPSPLSPNHRTPRTMALMDTVGKVAGKVAKFADDYKVRRMSN